jgi:predicted RNA-binding protein with PIN domain
MHHIALSDPEKEKKLINYLNAQNKQGKDRFTIIFDGKNNDIFGRTIYNIRRCQIIFTQSDESADEYIINQISRGKERTGMVIVSSDNAILNKAKKQKYKMLKSEEFINKYQVSIANSNDQQSITNTETDFWLEQFID